MELHYNLGDLILDAYEQRNINIEVIKISSMLDMLDDIGDSYEDLITVSATTANVDLEQTKLEIENIEKIINENNDVDITYPKKILDISKNIYKEAEYINSLEEENAIKLGLIVSNNLHSRLLANWANKFATIQIEQYIDNYISENPVTINYSKTDITNEDVIATIETNAEIQIINNSGNNRYIFKENGEFTFQYMIKGKLLEKTAKVTNIDKYSPQIIGVENGQIYTETVKLQIKDENLSDVQVVFNGQIMENYELNMELTKEGLYKIIAKDKAGNSTEISFQITEDKENSYRIKDMKIKNIQNNTTKSEFDNKLNFEISYEIFREDKRLKNDDIVATGDILKTQNGEEYVLIVAGDLNCDGDVNIKDMVKMRKYLLERDNLDENQMQAADCNVDELPITIKDFVKLRTLILMRNI